MIVLRKEVLFLATVLLIVLLNNAVGCSTRAVRPLRHHFSTDHHRHHHHHIHNKTKTGGHHSNRIPNSDKYKRAIAGNLVDPTALVSTSCGQTLCAYSPSYPSYEISKVIEDVWRILMSHDTEGVLKKRHSIDPAVTKYFFSMQHVLYNYDLPEPDGCDHYLNIFVPEEGYSADDGRNYFIVNLPNYRQRVQTVVCTSEGEVCDNNFTQSTCHQVYREEKLLALPMLNEFRMSDLRVKIFQVPNGCVCSKPV